MARLEMSFNIPYVTEEEALRIREAVDEVVVSVVGRVPNSVHVIKSDYTGPGRSKEETEQAAKEGRR